MKIEAFEMMQGVTPDAHYVVVAKNDDTKIGIRPLAGPMYVEGDFVVGAGFKLRIEGVPIMIPSYKSGNGKHYGSVFVKPLLKMPAMGHWVNEPLKQHMPMLVESLFNELTSRGLEIVADPTLVADYMLEAFLNEHPTPEAKWIEGEPKFINPKAKVADFEDDGE
jgi:hypothetical protein